MEGLPFAMDEGRGLLSARALWASIVGPQRLAMTEHTTKLLTLDNPEEIFSNIGAADAYVFIGVCLPINSVLAAVSVLFSRNDALGFNTSAPFVLNRVMGSGQVAGFMQLLQPGEQIYGQVVDPAVGPAGQRVVVAAVTF
jgi:hypothetical protein